MTPRIRTCTSLFHPPGEVSCDSVRETPRFRYAHRICRFCGKSQGIARITK